MSDFSFFVNYLLCVWPRACVSVSGKLKFELHRIYGCFICTATFPAFSASNMNEEQRKVFRIHEHFPSYVSNEKALC